MVGATLLAILLPLLAAGFLVAEQVIDLANSGFGDVADRIRSALPAFYERLDGLLAEFGTDAAGLAKQAGPAVYRLVPNLAADVFGAVLNLLFGLFVMLATQFVVYCEAPRLRALAGDLIPLAEADTAKILGTHHKTTLGAVVGGLVCAILQGLLIGVGLAIVGVRAPAVWGFLAALLSFAPVVGTALLWVPISVFLLLTGSPGSGWFLLAWGAVVGGGSDNLLRPWLLRRTGVKGVHPLLLFFAVLSGIGLFGMSGVVFGPLLVALLTTALRIYREQVVPRLRATEPSRPA
jgi:predicted PurR-regulated permease PerM